MLMILEGPDGSGKSTLARELQALAPYEIVHCGPPKTDNPFVEYVELLHSLEGRDVILDRSFYGEWVYAPVYRQRQAPRFAQLYYLELEAAKQGAAVVWCMANKEVLTSRFKQRGKDQSTFDRLGQARLEAVLEAYKNLMAECGLDSFNYDSGTQRAVDAAVELSQLKTKELATSTLRYGVGSTRPRLMIVGDRYSGYQNMPRPHDPRWQEPPFSHRRPFDRGGASHYLFDALRKLRLPPNQVYVTNSIKDELNPEESSALLARQWFQLGSPRVLALGKHAGRRCHAWLGSAKITVVPHPQYWRRFKHHSMEDYCEQLKLAL